jgi:hypothetical protein
MNEQERTDSKNKMTMANRLLPYFAACPHIFKPGIGVEAFVEELGRAEMKISALDSNVIGAITDMSPFVVACPQIVQPGMGAEAFVEEMERAALKFNGYFHKGQIEGA